MEDCIFCKIGRGEIPSYKIYEDDEHIAFLDIFPTMKGQTLVIPKKHLGPSVFDIDDESYKKLLLVSKKIANALFKSMNPIKTGMIAEGLEVEHIHIKLYPLHTTFGIKRVDPIPEKNEMLEIAEKIKSQLS